MQSILLFSEKLSRSWALTSSFLMCLNTDHVPLSADRTWSFSPFIYKPQLQDGTLIRRPLVMLCDADALMFWFVETTWLYFYTFRDASWIRIIDFLPVVLLENLNGWLVSQIFYWHRRFSAVFITASRNHFNQLQSLTLPSHFDIIFPSPRTAKTSHKEIQARKRTSHNFMLRTVRLSLIMNESNAHCLHSCSLKWIGWHGYVIYNYRKWWRAIFRCIISFGFIYN